MVIKLLALFFRITVGNGRLIFMGERSKLNVF